MAVQGDILSKILWSEGELFFLLRHTMALLFPNCYYYVGID